MTHENDISPRVFVGMPVYNGERYVKAALEAVLAQAFRDFELSSRITPRPMLPGRSAANTRLATRAYAIPETTRT